ncbi:MAG: hypothetical protein INR63_24720 [Actinomycetospora chiangmaiensis]|nr:hypothetical protein [Actinomycetospora chiangmaiensis]
MGRIWSPRWAMALLAAGAPVAATPAAAQGGGLIVQDTRLHTPPDSHEPQRAQVDLRNPAADAVTQVTLLCTFTGAGGSVLDTQTTSVPSIPAHASVQAEAIYYGWPRASGAACRLAEGR